MSSVGSYSDFEPNSIRNISDSISWLRKSTSYIISSILYLRNCFDEESFFPLQYETIKLRILSKKSPNPNVLKIIHYLQGSFDALELKYLRSMTMGFFEKIPTSDTGNKTFTFSNEPIELYQINFDYGNFENDKCFDFKTQTSLLLKEVISALSMMKNLPNRKKCYASFKLYYNDEITPPDYQPPGFIGTPQSGLFSIGNNCPLVNMGRLNTKFHSLSFQMTLNYDRNDLNLNQHYCLATSGTTKRRLDVEEDSEDNYHLSDESNETTAYSFSQQNLVYNNNKRFKNYSSIGKTIII